MDPNTSTVMQCTFLYKIHTDLKLFNRFFHYLCFGGRKTKTINMYINYYQFYLLDVFDPLKLMNKNIHNMFIYKL